MQAMGINGELRHLPARNEVLHAHSDHSKIKRVFKTTEAVSLLEGLTRMAQWAHGSGIRKSSKFNNIEITEKLPAVWLED
jgi:UDP-glucose 4-epimerase